MCSYEGLIPEIDEMQARVHFLKLQWFSIALHISYQLEFL